jgi:hypothetical protein
MGSHREVATVRASAKSVSKHHWIACRHIIVYVFFVEFGMWSFHSWLCAARVVTIPESETAAKAAVSKRNSTRVSRLFQRSFRAGKEKLGYADFGSKVLLQSTLALEIVGEIGGDVQIWG